MNECLNHSGMVATQHDHERRIESLEATVFGNGSEGLKNKMQRVLDWIANSENDRRLKMTIVGAVLMAVFNLACTLITIWK